VLEILHAYERNGLVVLALDIVLLDRMQVIRAAARDRRAPDIYDQVLILQPLFHAVLAVWILRANFFPVLSAKSWQYQSAVDFNCSEKGIRIDIVSLFSILQSCSVRTCKRDSRTDHPRSTFVHRGGTATPLLS
jgi:hypothetical protein